ncbi:leucine rich repeat protein [Pelomyxa schiedti]|nr:leucine rich repeat protein [Pelomyxa schiedti]
MSTTTSTTASATTASTGAVFTLGPQERRTVVLGIHSAPAETYGSASGEDNLTEMTDEAVRKLMERAKENSRLEITWKDLTLPSKFPPVLLTAEWVTSLVLPSNGITILPSGISRLMALNTLDLTNNKIQDMDECFTSLVNLTTLRLSSNDFVFVPNALSTMSNLATLAMSNNHLKLLPDFLCNLMHLRELSLSFNDIGDLPNNFGQLRALSLLSLNKNRLAVLPDSFGNLRMLSELNLSDNKFTIVPSCLYHLGTLETLKLSENMIAGFSMPHQHISNLVSLKILDLTSNRLRDFPEEISMLGSLTSLSASDNSFVSFPELNPPCLKSLVLSKNGITIIQPSVSQLTSITLLDVSYNDLESLPEEISSLKLNQLFLTGNKLSPPVHMPATCPPYTEEHVADEILPNLWLGNARAGNNKNFLLSKHVTHVLSVLPITKGPYPEVFNYLILPVEDHDEANLLEHFSTCHKFIDEARDSGTAVLVHCAAGISRSATIVTSYVMYKNNLGWQEALDFVKKRRLIVCPNIGFVKQLQHFGELSKPHSPCLIM